MGKRSKHYALRQRENRRRAKRIAASSRKRLDICDTAVQEGKMLDQDAQSSQLDCQVANKHSLREVEKLPENSHEAQQSPENRKAQEYKRIRQLLYMEQRRPRVFEKQCLRCLMQRNRKIEAINNTLQRAMFSGKTFGSRYLLAAIAKNRRQLQ